MSFLHLTINLFKLTLDVNLKIEIRDARADDLPFLWEMLWEAAAVNASVRAMGKEEALMLPAHRKYLEAWGRAGDQAVVALDRAARRIGAAWYRCFTEAAAGYGFVAQDIPELSVAVVSGMRGKGVGGALVTSLMLRARAEGYGALSLSVDRSNPALSLYQRLGFRDAGISGPGESSVIMLAVL